VKTTLRMAGCIAVPGIFLLLSVAAATQAAPQSNEAQGVEKAKVVARLALPGMHVNQMFVQHNGKKTYLYLHRPNRRAFAVVDVTRPEKPLLVDSATLKGPSQVEVAGSSPTVGIATSPENRTGANGAQANAGGGSVPAALPTETVKILDLTDPAHPKTLETFTGVTSMLPEDERKLIYIVNGDGLTIVRHRQTHPMPFCTSEDALTQEPNCQ